MLTGDQGLAEDLAQTALARAYASWPRIRRAGHPDAYVRRVMVNANHSRFRKRRVAEQLTATLPEPALVDATGGCDDRVTLIAALMSLPLGQRSVVVLRFWLDMTEAQVAEALGCSVGNVKARPPGRWPSCGPARPWPRGSVVSTFDEQDLGLRVGRALATITSGPVPAAAIVAQGADAAARPGPVRWR